MKNIGLVKIATAMFLVTLVTLWSCRNTKQTASNDNTQTDCATQIAQLENNHLLQLDSITNNCNMQLNELKNEKDSIEQQQREITKELNTKTYQIQTDALKNERDKQQIQDLLAKKSAEYEAIHNRAIKLQSELNQLKNNSTGSIQQVNLDDAIQKATTGVFSPDSVELGVPTNIIVGVSFKDTSTAQIKFAQVGVFRNEKDTTIEVTVKTEKIIDIPKYATHLKVILQPQGNTLSVDHSGEVELPIESGKEYNWNISITGVQEGNAFFKAIAMYSSKGKTDNTVVSFSSNSQVIATKKITVFKREVIVPWYTKLSSWLLNLLKENAEKSISAAFGSLLTLAWVKFRGNKNKTNQA